MILKSLAWILSADGETVFMKTFNKNVILGDNCGFVKDILKISRPVEFPG